MTTTVSTGSSQRRGARADARGRSPSIAFLLMLFVPWNAALVYVELNYGGRSIPGMLWVALIPCLAIASLMEARFVPDARVCFSYWPWLAWCSWIWLSLVWSDHFGVRAVQDALQLSLPIAMGMFSSRVVRTPDQLSSLLRAVAWSGAFVLLVAVASRIGLLAAIGIATDDRSAALYSVFVGASCLAAYPPRFRFALIGWLSMLIPSLVTGSRVATAVHLSLPFLHSRVRWIPKILIAVILACAGLAIFHSAPFQRRFFGEAERGSVGQVLRGDFLSFGRFENWPAIWEEACRRPWLGHGVGACAIYVPTVWENMTHPHNDYLRVYFEFGIVGGLLVASIILWQLLQIRRLIQATSGVARQAFVASWLAFWGFLLTSLTDNTLVYNAAYMGPLFTLLGAAYGVAFHATREGTLPRSTEPEVAGG